MLFGEVDHFVDLAFLAFAIAHESVNLLASAICFVNCRAFFSPYALVRLGRKLLVSLHLIACKKVSFIQSAICGVYFFAKCKSGSDGDADAEGAGAVPNAVNMAGDVAFVD